MTLISNFINYMKHMSSGIFVLLTVIRFQNKFLKRDKWYFLCTTKTG